MIRWIKWNTRYWFRDQGMGSYASLQRQQQMTRLVGYSSLILSVIGIVIAVIAL